MKPVQSLLEIRRLLVARGTLINSGFQGNVSAAISQSLHISADPAIVEMYEIFDGFPEGSVDGGSGIRILPLKEMLLEGKRRSSSRVAFADFLMGSDEIMVDIAHRDMPVLYDASDEVIADSFPIFISDLAHGKLDFL